MIRVASKILDQLPHFASSQRQIRVSAVKDDHEERLRPTANAAKEV
jgi:hypothetical protein